MSQTEQAFHNSSHVWNAKSHRDIVKPTYGTTKHRLDYLPVHTSVVRSQKHVAEGLHPT